MGEYEVDWLTNFPLINSWVGTKKEYGDHIVDIKKNKQTMIKKILKVRTLKIYVTR